MALTYTADIRPLFRPQDISCMRLRRVLLADAQWMCVPANAKHVYDKVCTGAMPPDAAWPPERVALFKQWMDEGYAP